MDWFAYFQEFHFASMLLRLFLALLCGGVIGLERVRKRRPAGFRTYMLVCLGATLTMLLGQYTYTMMETQWAEQVASVGGSLDIARYGAQVINGIGFLGAGTILTAGARKQVRGLTTAAGLWASATLGLAIGAGFYQGVAVAFVLLFFTMRTLPFLEALLVRHARHMIVYVEFLEIDHIHPLLSLLKNRRIQIRQVDIDRGGEPPYHNPGAVLTLYLPAGLRHETVLAMLSNSEAIRVAEEQ